MKKLSMPSNRKRFQGLLQKPDYRTKLTVFFLIGLVLFALTLLVKEDPLASNILVELLTTFITVAIIQFLWDFLGGDPIDTKLSEIQRNIDSLAGSLSTQIGADAKSGIIGTYENLLNDEVAKSIQKAQVEVKILQTWMGNIVLLENSISDAVNNGCMVKILLLNPDSYQAKARSKDVGEVRTDKVSEQINANLYKIARIYSYLSVGTRKYLEVRLYDSTPIMTLYWIDDIAYLGLYWRDRSAIISPQIKISISTKLIAIKF